MALTNKLSAIGDAIREKTGKTELLTLDAMPLEIASIETGGGGDIEVEPIVLTGDCNYACSGVMAGKYIKLFSNTISTKDITTMGSMFYKNTIIETIPFDINIEDSVSNCQLLSVFQECNNLKELPKIKGNGKIYNINYMFYGCWNLREIPDNYFDSLNFSSWPTATSAYSCQANALFHTCRSLRKVPLNWLKNMNPQANTSYNYLYSCFNNCNNLDEVIDLPLPHTAPYTSNLFSLTFASCHRLKELIFQTNEDGSPLVKQWKSQSIDLTDKVGYTSGQDGFITKYNSGITNDKRVKDDATYQALKNDPDWWASDFNYSRYNHDSAVNTINSLPDTSAYLAEKGGTNNIRFKGVAGAYTDGGAINTLTAEEIAVATAKGWTVSFT